MLQVPVAVWYALVPWCYKGYLIHCWPSEVLRYCAKMAKDIVEKLSFRQFDISTSRARLSILRYLRYRWPWISLRGHLRSLIFAPVESAYMTFYWSSIATLILSCRVSEIELSYAKSRFFDTPPLFRSNFGVFPLEYRCVMLGSAKSEHPGLTKYFWRVPTYVITIPQRHGRTDGRTDRRLCHYSNTALCVASGGKIRKGKVILHLHIAKMLAYVLLPYISISSSIFAVLFVQVIRL